MVPCMARFVMRRRAITASRVGLKRCLRELPLSVDTMTGCARGLVVRLTLSDLFERETGSLDGAARVNRSARRAERRQN